MDTDKIAKMVYALANTPASMHYVRDSIKSLAETRLRLELIAKKNSVSAYHISQIHKNENEKHFLKIIDRVMLLHRRDHQENPRGNVHRQRQSYPEGLQIVPA